MRSSTSSSEREAPPGPWGLTWLVTALLAVGGLVLCETSLRAHGHHINVDDNSTLWALTRARATGDRVAVIGTSRMQLAFSSAEFAAQAKREPVNLAIDGVTAPPILDDLAADPNFHGLVICDVAEWELALDETAAAVWIGQQLWRMPGAAAERWVAARAQKRLVLLGIGGRYLLQSAVEAHAWPPTSWLQTLANRDRRADYTKQVFSLPARRDRARSHVPANAPSPEAWLASTARLDRAADAIRARGGLVVFVRMPMTGGTHDLAERAFPRAQYWDRFAAKSHGIAIHADDVPAWRAIDVPDEIHLDRQDQSRFTRALVDELRARHALD